MKKKTNANPIYRHETRASRLDGCVDLLSQILFFEHYRASAELQSLSRPDLLISRNNLKITRFIFDHCCEIQQMKINGKT